MPVTSLFKNLSRRSRLLKMELFERHLALRGDESVLDIGSQIDEQSRQVVERIADKGRITAVNIDPQHLEAIAAAYPSVRTQCCDARALPFADKAFDVVYSNAVIEHVGSLADQERMAREVQRVGKRWFLTTPNRWYPFEFHARMPLVSWLPPRWMHAATRLWAYSHINHRYQYGSDHSDVSLLTARQLRRMFPTSRILKPRVTFWPETLVVVGPVDAEGKLLPADAGHAGRSTPGGSTAAPSAPAGASR